MCQLCDFDLYCSKTMDDFFFFHFRNALILLFSFDGLASSVTHPFSSLAQSAREIPVAPIGELGPQKILALRVKAILWSDPVWVEHPEMTIVAAL